MTNEELVGRAIDHFAFSEELPIDAIEATLDGWEALDVSRHLGALLNGYVTGADLSERTEAAMQIVIHLLGEKADRACFPDLCALALDPDRFISALGDDGTVLSYPGILVATFDGDPAPLHRLIETPTADDYARSDAFMVLAYLTRTGRLPEREMYDYLASIAPRLQSADGTFVWFGYAEAIAALGFSGLAGVVEAAFTRGDIRPEAMTSADFWQELRDSQQNPGDLSKPIWTRFEPMGSTIEHLEALNASDDEGELELDIVPVQPVRTAPKVGRNDPCPCGSGKKFKKCCIDVRP